MGKLINVDKPEAGEDPCELWRTVCDLIDALNDLTVSITPSSCIAKISDGDISLDLSSLVTVQEIHDRDPSYGEDGGGDGSGDGGSSGDGT